MSLPFPTNRALLFCFKFQAEHAAHVTHFIAASCKAESQLNLPLSKVYYMWNHDSGDSISDSGAPAGILKFASKSHRPQDSRKVSNVGQ